jgi:serine/threonine protein kinase
MEISVQSPMLMGTLEDGRKEVSAVTTPLSPVLDPVQIPFKASSLEEPKDKEKQLIKGLARYRVLSRLGKGSSGEVLLGVDQTTGEKVAIKVIKTDRLSPESTKCLHNEVRVLKRVRHKRIACLREVIRTRRHCCLVLEWVDGHDLRPHWNEDVDNLSHAPLGEVAARKVFKQLVEAVSYLHENNIVHRDIKLDNIMVTATGEVKLVDFGFATPFEGTTPLRQFCGTPYYASPEIFRHVPYLTEVDVWSLGVVLYLLVTGVMPFESPQAIVSGTYTIPPHVTPLCADLIRVLLSPSRPPVSQIMRHPWLLEDDNEEIAVPV